MDPVHHPDICDSSFPFTLEKTPYTAFGSDGSHQPKVKPKLLSLFPLKPAFEPLTRKSSVKSFSGEATQQTNEQDSRTVVVAVRGDREFGSRDPDGSAVLLSSYLALECVPEKPDAQNPLKKLRFVDSVCHQSSSTPPVEPYQIAAGSLTAKRLDGIGQFVDLKSRSTYQYNALSTTYVGKSNGFGPALPSRALAINGPPLSLTTEVQLGAHAVGNLRPSARHGPRPRSSSFRGVTHYKRTGRWEAHIWNKGKQIYLGASSTAEKAARAYDRAAIHFRKLGAELNFRLQDYAEELGRLVELSEGELVTMLRKQSAGDGTMFPEYPRNQITELQEAPREVTEAPRYFPVREKVDQVEPIPHKEQIDSELARNRLKPTVSCSTFVRTMVQSDQPQVELNFHVPQAVHVSKRSGQYIQVIDNMTADLQNPRQWLN